MMMITVTIQSNPSFIVLTSSFLGLISRNPKMLLSHDKGSNLRKERP